jgi:hypothetical protein
MNCMGNFAVAVLTCMTAGTSQVFAAESSCDWASVMALPNGSEVQVDLTTSQVATGALESATADDLILVVAHVDVMISRQLARRVALLAPPVMREAKRGFIVGSIFGALVGAVATKGNRLSWGAFLAASWGGLGALIGAIDASLHQKQHVIYATCSARAAGTA